MPSDEPSELPRDAAEELRQVAFGRASTDAERRAAADKLALLAVPEIATPLPDPAPTPGESPDDAPDASEPDNDNEESAAAAQPAPMRRRSIAMIWLLPAVIASLVVGGVVDRAITAGRLAPVPTPSASQSPVTDPAPTTGSGLVGSLVAANAWLARIPSNKDTFPSPGVIDNQSLSSVRLIKNVRDNDTLITVWGAKDHSDGICLLAGLPNGLFASTCVPPKVFTERGIRLGFNGYEVSWDGVATSLTLPPSTREY